MGKTNKSGLGRSLVKSKFSKKPKEYSELHTSDGIESSGKLKSIIETNDLDEFVSTAIMSGRDFTAEKEAVTIILDPESPYIAPSSVLRLHQPKEKEPEEDSDFDEEEEGSEEFSEDLDGEILDSDEDLDEEEGEEEEEEDDSHIPKITIRKSPDSTDLAIPRRPEWDSTTTRRELIASEKAMFLEWRRQLAVLEEEEHAVVTPYEKNLEVWRQLWRVCERSDVVAQIIDSRNPLLYRCPDLEEYVESMGKETFVILNKADLLPQDVREEWARYFADRGIEHVFFSANQEQLKMMEREERLRRQEEEIKAMKAEQELAGGVDLEFIASTADFGIKPKTNKKKDKKKKQEQQQQQKEGEGESDQTAKTETKAPEEAESKEQKESDAEEEEEGEWESDGEWEEDSDEEETIKKPVSKYAQALNKLKQHNISEETEGEKPQKKKIHIDAKDLGRIYSREELIEFFKHKFEHLVAKRQALAKEAAGADGVPPKHLLHPQLIVGMVGYPNVGKSSSINVLIGSKKVAVGATPGKTKHFQTLALEENVTLCDCPGLVFPSIVSTKADMICNGVLPIDQIRDPIPPAALLSQRIPRRVFEHTYGMLLPIPTRMAMEQYNLVLAEKRAKQTEPKPKIDIDQPLPPPTSHELLNSYARFRGYMTHKNNADQQKAARELLKDYTSGKLLFCHLPPDNSFGVAGFCPTMREVPAEHVPSQSSGDASTAEVKPKQLRKEQIGDEELFKKDEPVKANVKSRAFGTKEFSTRHKAVYSPVPISQLAEMTKRARIPASVAAAAAQQVGAQQSGKKSISFVEIPQKR